ncbi:MAG: DUF465 domain-containing protein [Gammaproteobacteria bacterium]|nr:DUF465 domain-containing protein [Gammaproteobacteria bacterium]
MLDDETVKELQDKLHHLVLEHSDLDDVIRRLADDPTVDQIRLRRLKKRKLQLKDMIIRIRSKLIPDIEA